MELLLRQQQSHRFKSGIWLSPGELGSDEKLVNMLQTAVNQGRVLQCGSADQQLLQS